VTVGKQLLNKQLLNKQLLNKQLLNKQKFSTVAYAASSTRPWQVQPVAPAHALLHAVNRLLRQEQQQP